MVLCTHCENPTAKPYRKCPITGRDRQDVLCPRCYELLSDRENRKKADSADRRRKRERHE